MQRDVKIAKVGDVPGLRYSNGLFGFSHRTGAPISMSTAAMIDLLFVAVVFAGVMYWIFVAPARARRKRHQR